MPEESPISVHVVRVTQFAQNCMLIVCNKTKKCAVVDPGGDVERIMDEARKYGVRIEKIWISHGHLDHGGGAKELKAFTAAPIEGPAIEDALWVSSIPQNARQCGMTGMDSFVPDRWLKDGDTVEIGETTWQVIHCPGHTPGHVVFYNKEANFAAVGDVLFKNSIGRADLMGSDPKALIRSITQKLWPLGDVSFIPGHGSASSFGAERQHNPYVSDAVLSR
ncbi:MAG: MBL fold metallo-hydrolase [Alphaproteobacteria bacterium]|nr:MBL fold metallo-hydrolase [Alphaproteobacteria bacterium]